VTASVRRFATACLVATAVLGTVAGCGETTAKKPGAAAAAPAVEEKLPPVDPATAVSSPQGWARGPRSKDYLVRYTPTAQKTHPSVTITAAEPPAGLTEVTAASHDAFVQAIATGLAEAVSQDGTSTLVKKPAAVTLGDHHAVAYTAPGDETVGPRKEPIERACLALVVNGRLVTVTARAPKGKLADEGRLAAKAVAAAIAAPRKDEPAVSFAPPPPAAGEEPATSAETAAPAVAP
jgi:hypothetical protein